MCEKYFSIERGKRVRLPRTKCDVTVKCQLWLFFIHAAGRAAHYKHQTTAGFRWFDVFYIYFSHIFVFLFSLPFFFVFLFPFNRQASATKFSRIPQPSAAKTVGNAGVFKLFLMHIRNENAETLSVIYERV